MLNKDPEQTGCFFRCASISSTYYVKIWSGRLCFGGGSSYFPDKIFDQHEWQGWASGNLRDDNDFADVTLACEDAQQVEAHKVILAGQVRFTKLSHSQHHINNINNSIEHEQQTRGCSCRWGNAQLPHFPNSGTGLWMDFSRYHCHLTVLDLKSRQDQYFFQIQGCLEHTAFCLCRPYSCLQWEVFHMAYPLSKQSLDATLIVGNACESPTRSNIKHLFQNQGSSVVSSLKMEF